MKPPAQALRGQVLSLEALLAFLVWAGLVAALTVSSAGDSLEGVERLHALQRAGDLLVYWFSVGRFDERAMARDFRAVFPDKNGVVEAGGARVAVGTGGGDALVRAARYWDGTRFVRVAVTVYLPR